MEICECPEMKQFEFNTSRIPFTDQRDCSCILAVRLNGLRSIDIENKTSIEGKQK